jgi:hypothetical protein
MFVCYECNEMISGKIFMANDYSFCSCNHRNNYLKIFHSFNNKKMKKTISLTNINSINNTSTEPILDKNEYEKKEPERSNFDIYQAYNFLKIKKNRICSIEIFKMFLDIF